MLFRSPLQIESIPNRPRRNSKYTIRDIKYYDLIDKTGLFLEEIHNPHTVRNIFGQPMEPSFNLIRFKKAQKKKNEVVVQEEEEVACL